MWFIRCTLSIKGICGSLNFVDKPIQPQILSFIDRSLFFSLSNVYVLWLIIYFLYKKVIIDSRISNDTRLNNSSTTVSLFFFLYSISWYLRITTVSDTSNTSGWDSKKLLLWLCTPQFPELNGFCVSTNDCQSGFCKGLRVGPWDVKSYDDGRRWLLIVIESDLVSS